MIIILYYGLGLSCLTRFLTLFQLYRGVSFIGGGNRSTRRKPPTCRKSLTNFITFVFWNYSDSVLFFVIHQILF
jgi:hypothetical protein